MAILREYVEDGKKIIEFTKDGETVSHIVVTNHVDEETLTKLKEQNKQRLQETPQEQPPQEEQQSTDSYALWRLQQLEDKINYLYYKEKGVIK